MGSDFIDKNNMKTKKELLKLHEKYTTGLYPDKWLELTWTHSNIVLEIVEIIARDLEKSTGIKVDMDLLTEGTLLHDIGIYSCFDEDINPNDKLLPYIHHGFIGAEILKKEGFSLAIQRIALTHSATGFTKEDILREKLNYEAKDYIPVSLEEEIVCYADKFHTKYPSFSTYDEQVTRLKKFDPAREVKMETFKRKFGIPDLSKLIIKHDSWNKEFDKWFGTI